MSTLLGAGGPLLISRLATLPCRYTSTRLPALLAFNARRLHANSDGNHEQKKQLSLKVRFRSALSLAPVLLSFVYISYNVQAGQTHTHSLTHTHSSTHSHSLTLTRSSTHSPTTLLLVQDRLKVMTKEYGKVTIGVYLVYDVISFGCFYSALKMGVDIGALLTKVWVRVAIRFDLPAL